MTEMPVKLMRQSTINTGTTCLKRLHYDQTRTVNKGSEARAQGTAFHAGMEAMYNGLSVGDQLDATLAALEREIREATDGFTWETSLAETQACLVKLLAHVRENDLRWDPEVYSVVGVEVNFRFPWTNGWHASGTIDLILLNKEDGWLYIVDFKTAKSRWRKGKEKARQTAQPIWYSHWGKRWYVETFGDRDPHAAERPVAFYFDVFSWTKTGGSSHQRIPAVWTAKQEKVIFEMAETYAALLDRGGPFPPNVNHHLCDHRWCDHWDVCPYGEILNHDR